MSQSEHIENPSIGSFFEHPSTQWLSGSHSDDLPDEAILANSGRAAALLALRTMTMDSPIERVLVPSYYCSEVTEYLAAEFPVETYQSNPIVNQLPCDASPNDVVVVVSYFGMKALDTNSFNARILFDATHIPDALFKANLGHDWVFGSLRKIYPVSTGGFVRSPSARLVEFAQRDDQNEVEDIRGLDAMKEKSKCLSSGEPDTGSSWYQQIQDHEEAIAGLVPASIGEGSLDVLRSFDWARANEVREANLARLLRSLDPRPKDLSIGGSMGLSLLLSSKEDAGLLRSHLVGGGVFPARLWPLSEEQSSAVDVDISNRILFIHCDYRYSSDEMQYVAIQINEFFRTVEGGS